jgi:hypothetical protein
LVGVHVGVAEAAPLLQAPAQVAQVLHAEIISAVMDWSGSVQELVYEKE